MASNNPSVNRVKSVHYCELIDEILVPKVCRGIRDLPLSAWSQNWDEELDQSVVDKWRNFISNLEQVKELSVERCYTKESVDQIVPFIELHGFGETSNDAYGACIYIRCESDSETHCKLVTSKTRVSPVKSKTIPGLERLASLITVRLISKVYEVLKSILRMDERCCWTDSRVALTWIQST